MAGAAMYLSLITGCVRRLMAVSWQVSRSYGSCVISVHSKDSLNSAAIPSSCVRKNIKNRLSPDVAFE